MAESEGIKTTEDGMYFKYFEIRCPSIQTSYDLNQQTYGMAVKFMNFSSDSRFLMVFFQIVDGNLQRKNDSNEGIYILWDIKLNNTIKTWEA